MGRGGDDSRAGLYCALVVVVLVTAASLIGTSLQKLSSTEYGLQYDVHKKLLASDAKEGGLHAGPPGFTFVKYPSTYITTNIPEDFGGDPDLNRNGMCVSRDGLRVQIRVTFQYQLPMDNVRKVTKKYRDLGRWKYIVNAAAVSAIQFGCSRFETSSFQSERGSIQAEMETALRRYLEGNNTDEDPGVYARAIGLQLRNVELPESYRQAVAAKQEAAEDIGLAVNQRLQEVTRAQTLLQSAVENAKKINDTAQIDKNLRIQEATLEAEGISLQFETEASVYEATKASLNLTHEGLLAYLGNRVVQLTKSAQVSLTEPAKGSYKDDL